ncbi:MAG: type II toxin-antitoxin system RelE/ParE family toxin [Paludibacteraceae bacterium]|nr:type II toxin-antitoxin system RelE/ParE family toxin [Paludibacteraceae bacterium]MBQ9672591.1 type II toxin-antitoxin system RelE/ParE family toxin [Prevotella sp.]
MAQIIWKDDASHLLEAHIDYAMAEFGHKAVKNWYSSIRSIESRLAQYPESYTIETLLLGKKHQYRSAIFMHNFKLIYYYELSEDTVYIDIIWDMRMNPASLQRKIR